METRKLRSPSYPTIDLEVAVAKVRDIQSAYSTSSVDREAIASVMGYTSMSGTALQTLSSLISYGLLEKRGKGEAGVTDLAMQILFAESTGEYANAAREAALRPSIFGQVAEKFGSHVPHKDGVVAFLRRNRFTEKAAEIATKMYISSMRFVGTLGDGDRSDSAEPVVENVSPSTADPAVEMTTGRTPMMNQANAVGEFRELVRGSVSGGSAFRLLGKTEFDAEQWQDVMDMLEVQIKIAKRRRETASSMGTESAEA